jgi:hypothetical protein
MTYIISITDIPARSFGLLWKEYIKSTITTEVENEVITRSIAEFIQLTCTGIAPNPFKVWIATQFRGHLVNDISDGYQYIEFYDSDSFNTFLLSI